MTKITYEKMVRLCDRIDKLSVCLKDEEINTSFKDIIAHDDYLTVQNDKGKYYIPYENISHVIIIK